MGSHDPPVEACLGIANQLNLTDEFLPRLHARNCTVSSLWLVAYSNRRTGSAGFQAVHVESNSEHSQGTNWAAADKISSTGHSVVFSKCHSFVRKKD